jgi:hypothetical protein
MTEFERWLRATLAAAADGPPPRGLMAAILRRRRRRLIRAAAGGCAVVVLLGLAVPLALRAPGPAAGVRTGPAGQGHGVAAAPGTVPRDCASQNGGDQEMTGWRAHSVHAGPVWFVWARDKGYWTASRPLGHGQVQAVGVPVAVQAGATAVVRVPAATRSRFRFLAGFNTSDRYSMRDGQAGVTFAACPPSHLGPVTVFWIGYLNSGLNCIPFDVTVPGQRPVQVALSTGGGTCARK